MCRILVYCFLIMLLTCSLVGAEINMDIIAQIESSNNPLAYNARSGATGMYQITEICLREYNNYNNADVAIEDMFNANTCYAIANWYMNARIPRMLKYYGIDDTDKNRLWAYNAGIGKIEKCIMPLETKNYINKYKEMI